MTGTDLLMIIGAFGCGFLGALAIAWTGAATNDWWMRRRRTRRHRREFAHSRGDS